VRKFRWCVVLRDIDFLLKICDRFLACLTSFLQNFRAYKTWILLWSNSWATNWLRQLINVNARVSQCVWKMFWILNISSSYYSVRMCSYEEKSTDTEWNKPLSIVFSYPHISTNIKCVTCEPVQCLITSSGSKGAWVGYAPPDFAAPCLPPPQFSLNFTFMFVWLTYTADNSQPAKF